MMGGQVEDQGPALQLHQAHPDEEVEGPGGPGRRASGRVGRSSQNPKARGQGCGMSDKVAHEGIPYTTHDPTTSAS